MAIDDELNIQAITINHVADVGAFPVWPAVIDTHSLVLAGERRGPGRGPTSCQ
jgi:hypothetical protein